MSAVSDLGQLLASMSPEQREGDYVFVTVVDDAERARILAEHTPEAMVREREGLTLVLTREAADAANLRYDFVAAWITLTVHSDLAAVGLTAAFAEALTERGISCNVLAGYYHDHLLVPRERVNDALHALRQLTLANKNY